MEVEDVTGVGLAARWATQQQGDLAIGLGLLGEVVVDHQRVFAVLHPLLSDSAARVGGEELKGCGVAGTGHHDDGVLEGPEVLQGLDGLGDRGVLLAHGDVDALHALALLIQDRVDRDRRLTGLAVTDDEFALSSSDGRHCVNGFDTRLERLTHGLATRDAGRLDLHAPDLRVDQWSLAVDGVAERVHDSSEQSVAHRHREDASGRANDLFFFDPVDRSEDDCADGLFVQVHGETYRAVFELEELVHLRRGQPGDARDAVTHFDDAADLLGRHRGVKVVHVFAQRLSDLAGANGEFGHDTVLFLVNSIQSGLEQLTRGDCLA